MSLSTLADRYCPLMCRPILSRVQQSPIGKRLASGVFYLAFASVVTKGIGLISTILIVRILGRESYGEYGMLLSTSTLLVTIADFGLSFSVTKFIPELLVKDRERVGKIIALNYLSILVFSIFFAFILCIVSPWFCAYLLAAPQLTGMMRLATLMIVLASFAMIQKGILRGFQNFNGLALSEILASIVKMVFLVLGSYYDGLRGAMFGYGLGLLCENLLSSYFIHGNVKKYQIKYSFRKSHQELPILYKFSMPILFTSVISTITYWLV
ncbi:MAG: oligosaccharide flippase family protein, partial [Planctomycetaceae bacterium]|nr:oligosaccharide flippase family protein [Planctomycetaceae bacterium]